MCGEKFRGRNLRQFGGALRPHGVPVNTYGHTPVAHHGHDHGRGAILFTGTAISPLLPAG